MNKKGRLIIISAPSGAGKGTVIREVTRLRPEIKYSVSATTRAPRPGEVNGEHYYFVDAAEFDAMAARGEFLEHESYVGNSYGTPRGPIERNMDEGIDTILEIEVKGARQVREKIPDVISIFLAVPDEEELHRRLTGRGKMDEAELASRIQTAREELAAAEEYTFTVVNDDAERAAREIIAILDFNREDYL